MEQGPKRRLDPHRVLWWSCLGVVAVLLIFWGLSHDGRIVTVFTPEGRRLFAPTLRFLFAR